MPEVFGTQQPMSCFRKQRVFFFSASVLCLCLFVSTPVRALEPPLASIIKDSDADGLGDQEEVRRYHTSPEIADTDGDTIGDGEEIQHGYSPLVVGKKLSEVDTDADGIMDSVELAFGTDLAHTDSDKDGFPDGVEFFSGYDPRSAEPTLLQKSVRIHTVSQRLDYELAGVTIGTYIVSTGKRRTPTPTGTFTITKKAPRAWSRSAKLWMPWWLNFTGARAPSGMYAIHELPEWPGGKKEGANHLGIPVSHGCVRLGIGSAKTLYDWAPVGTPVITQKD